MNFSLAPARYTYTNYNIVHIVWLSDERYLTSQRELHYDMYRIPYITQQSTVCVLSKSVTDLKIGWLTEDSMYVGVSTRSIQDSWVVILQLITEQFLKRQQTQDGTCKIM